MVLLITMLITTILILYDLTIQLFIRIQRGDMCLCKLGMQGIWLTTLTDLMIKSLRLVNLESNISVELLNISLLIILV